MAQDLSASTALTQLPIESDEEYEDLSADADAPPPLDHTENQELQAWLNGELDEDPRTAYRESASARELASSSGDSDSDNDTDIVTGDNDDDDDDSACADGESEASAAARADHVWDDVNAVLQGDIANDAVGLYRVGVSPEGPEQLVSGEVADAEIDVLAASVAKNLRKLNIGVPELQRSSLTISANFYEGDDTDRSDGGMEFVLCATIEISTDNTARFFKLGPSCLDPLRMRKVMVDGDDADTDDYTAAQTDEVDYAAVYDDYAVRRAAHTDEVDYYPAVYDDDDDSPPAPPQPRTWIPERGRVAVMLMIDAPAPILVGLMTERYDCTDGAGKAVEDRGLVTVDFLDQFTSGTNKRTQWLDPDATGELCDVPTKSARNDAAPSPSQLADSDDDDDVEDATGDGDVSIDDADATGNSGTVPPAEQSSDGMSGFSNPEAEHEWSNRKWGDDIVCAFSRDIATGKLMEVRFALALNTLHLRKALQAALANSSNTI